MPLAVAKRKVIRTYPYLFGLVFVVAAIFVGAFAYMGQEPSKASALTTVPTRMNFQGRLADSTGNIKQNGTYNMRLRLYTAASGGTAVWTEDRLVSAGQGVTLTNGLFALQLGSVTSLPASLFASGPLYLEVELPTPATATSSSPSWTEGAMTPRNQMATSAYAYNSELLDGQDGDYYLNASNMNAGTLSVGRGGTGLGSLTTNGIVYGNGTSAAGVTGAGTSGQILQANVSGVPGFVTVSGDALLAAGGAITVNRMGSQDIRTLAPSNGTASKLQFGFTSWANNNTAPYADYLLMRSYQDGTGGLDNLLLVRKDTFGLRQCQQTFGSATAFSSCKDVMLQGDSVSAASISATGAITGSSTVQGTRFISTVATGTAPLTVASTTKVTNLNADLLDGLDSTAFLSTSSGVQLQGVSPGTAQTGNINITGTVIAGGFSGSGSGLTNLSATNLSSGTIASARVSGSYTGITGTGALAAGSIASGFGTIVTGNTIQGTRLISTVATGTAPLTVTSTTKVTNLNVDLLDGLDSTAFAAASGSGSYIQNTTTPQTANFNVTGTGKIGNITIGTSNIDSSTDLFLEGTGDVGLTAGSAFNVGASEVYVQTPSMHITGDVSVGGTFRLTGGVTASRPSSPSEGTIYFDTTTKEVLTYANGKWKTDGNTETIVVAASNSSQAAKDAADYIADGNGGGAGDGDQVQINAALVAGAGGKVYLMPGDYTVDATILIPDDTTLAGSGSSTQIEANFGGGADSMVEESSLSAASGMTIQDVHLDGRRDINISNSDTIYLDASKVTINRVNVVNTSRYGIFVSGNEAMITENTVAVSNINMAIYGSNNIIKNNRSSGATAGINVSGTYAQVEGNISENNSYGFGIDASRSSITGNKAFNNIASGINLYMTAGNTVSNNTLKDNATWGIEIADDSSIDSAVITSNIIEGNSSGGIWAYNATNTIISDNKFKDNGGTGYNYAIVLEGTSTSNTINGNDISDSSSTTRGYAIVFYAGAVNNYISDNTIDSPGYVNDLNASGSNTYANQIMTASSGNMTTSAYQLQMASATSLDITTGTGDFSVSVNGTERLELSSTATKLWFSGQYSQRLCHNTADGSTGRIATIGDCSAGGADFAEYYGSPGNVPTGTIVQYDASRPVQQVPDPTAPGRMGNKAFVRTASERSKALGVHSTNPYVDILGKEYYTEADNIIPVGLAGRVPVRVNASGGAIAIGDPVTLSSTPGVGAKATTAGQIIGYSMENYSGEGEGTVVVLISTGYWAPDTADVLQGQYSTITDLQVTGTADIAQLNVSGLATIKELKVIDSLSVQGTLAVVGKVETGEILVNGHITTRSQTPTIEAGVAMGAPGANVAVSVDGTDTAGTVVLKAASEQVSSGVVAHIDFADDFPGGYKTVLSATNDSAADLRVYIVKTDKGFDIVSKDSLKAGVEYAFDYIVIGAIGRD